MRDRQQKKAQSKINHMVRKFNKNLSKDELWKGRFYVHQTDANWERFEDGSGGMLNVWVEVRDKKTGLYHGFRLDNYDKAWNLWTEVNDFIVLDSGVWDNIDMVKNDTTNWEKVKWIPKNETW